MWNDQVFVSCEEAKSNRASSLCDLDDFIKDAMRRKMFKMHDTGIYPMAEKLVKEMEEGINF